MASASLQEPQQRPSIRGSVHDPKALLVKWEEPTELERLADERDLAWETMQVVNKENIKLKLTIRYLRDQLKTTYGALATENLDLNATVKRLLERLSNDR